MKLFIGNLIRAARIGVVFAFAYNVPWAGVALAVVLVLMVENTFMVQLLIKIIDDPTIMVRLDDKTHSSVITIKNRLIQSSSGFYPNEHLMVVDLCLDGIETVLYLWLAPFVAVIAGICHFLDWRSYASVNRW